MLSSPFCPSYTPFSAPNTRFPLINGRSFLQQSFTFDFFECKCAGELRDHDFLDSISSSPSLEAIEIFKKNGGLPITTITGFNQMLMSLIASEKFEMTLKLISELPSLGFAPDNWTYSIFVCFYCQLNEPTEAKNYLERMLENGFEPTIATFTTLINSFCKIGRLQDALQVFDVMYRINCHPTINTYNCLLKGLCYVGKVEEAYDLLTTIKRSSLRPDIYTYTAVMNGLCKVGRSNEAFELLDEALQMDLTPSVVTYNTLLNGFFKEGRPLSGIGLLKRMKERNCRPDYISYNTLFHGLIKWGKIRAALGVYREMAEIGFRADERMMNTLLRGVCRRSREERELVKHASDLFDDMRNGQYTIDPCAYDLVIEALINGKEFDKAFMVLNEMITIGHSPRTFTFDVVTRSLCGTGDVDKALSVLMLLIEPCSNHYDLVINELNRQGRSLDACYVYGVALKRGVAPKRKPAKRNIGIFTNKVYNQPNACWDYKC
ncbi:pentatricopeptide repeat-containing protein mitochondrial-like [Dorcoceras hygrometricum]|uniref:Pentatricopeptide repeat-containing protein mitochondrial-like n=1 Tax=Dorcoceras hygrometricum TaxID=472368 RepID=A0A2Z7D824_9LAMI|nr:pentatricopeptide repeat-containing protein mitochondrial-like [Dorcoceras hygrometricum]